MIRVAWVRRSVLDRKRSGIRGAPWAILALLAATGLRSAVDPWVEGVPFLTFFPTVVIASLLLGWRWGAVVLAGATVIANYMFQPPPMVFSLQPNQIITGLAFLAAGSLMIWVSESLRRAIVELDQARQRERELNLELAHRVNNSLTVVQGLAMQTSRVHRQPESFYEAFSGRLLALSEANKILMSGSTEMSQLPDLAAAAVKPFLSRGQMTLDGPRCAIPRSASVHLVLALHELGTNATKYGALSSPSGHVELTWSMTDADCRMLWRETGGPPVKPPERRGLGARLLTPQAGLGDVQLVFDPLGVRCQITVNGAQRLHERT